jgi:hypothetical protein
MQILLSYVKQVFFFFQVHQLRLDDPPYSIADLLRELDTDRSIEPLPFSGRDTSHPLIVWRQRSEELVKKRVFMSETGTYLGDLAVNEESGYYIVHPHESVIFLSKTQPGGM